MQYKLLSLLVYLVLCSRSLFADDMEKLARQLHLYGGEKAIIQWKRVFSSPRHLKRYKLDTLSESTRERLQIYLIEHAADSDQPIVPGL